MSRPAVLIVNTPLSATHLNRSHPGVVVHTLPFHYSYIATQPTSQAYLLEYLRAAEAYCRRHQIAAVVALNDMGAIIAAILNNRLKLRGPSEAAVLLATNKFLLRQHTAAPSEYFAITPATDLETLNYPFFLKAPYSAFGLYAKRIESPTELKSFLAQEWTDLCERNVFLRTLLSELSCIQAYPLAIEDMFYGERLRTALPQVTVEGVVEDGRVSVIAIADSNMTADGSVFASFTVPTQMTESIQAQLIKETTTLATQIGLDNTGFNVEFWCQADSLDVIEINTRISHSFKRLYKASYGFDVLKNAIDIALGNQLDEMNSIGSKAGLYNVRVKKDGVARDLFDFKAARANENVAVRFKPGRQITLNGHFGDVIADVLITGDSFLTMQGEADQVINKLLRPVKDTLGSHVLTGVSR